MSRQVQEIFKPLVVNIILPTCRSIFRFNSLVGGSTANKFFVFLVMENNTFFVKRLCQVKSLTNLLYKRFLQLNFFPWLFFCIFQQRNFLSISGFHKWRLNIKVEPKFCWKILLGSVLCGNENCFRLRYITWGFTWRDLIFMLFKYFGLINYHCFF